MNSGELRSVLEEAGLSPYQADAYSTLLRLGSASATELADACTVPQARIYDVLRDLEGKGYIETFEQGSLRARARNPEVVLDDLRGRAERLATAAEEIEHRWEQPDLEANRVSIVKRFETVFDRAASIIRDAQYEVQLSATPEQFAELRPALEVAVANGAIVNLSLHTDPETPTRSLRDGAGYEDAATEVRHRALPAPFLALVDRTLTCFAPHARSLNSYGVLVDDYTLTYVFHWYFQTCLWEVWEPIHDARPDEPPRRYTDIRRCVREVEPLLDEAATVRARVEGFETASGRRVELDGRIVDVVYAGAASSEGELPLSRLAGQVTIELETDDGPYSVGGWGAVLEDVEATRITILSAEKNPEEGTER
ncbi:TrmB family transcriptional regulator [Halegenticoccus tardaugens]|uniref:TrmB family transcriptional regulator n=1 Tax=Halegenticoccus tardaugens TaxID=2071624 RepID=UPI00100BABDA|nr:TrmB family transcriptional regulator [Halegenticoccus tardaugens]